MSITVKNKNGKWKVVDTLNNDTDDYKEEL